MKKILSLLSIFAILFSSSYNSVIAASKYIGATAKTENTKIGVSSTVLTTLLTKQGLTKEGIDYIKKIRKITKSDVSLLTKGTSADKVRIRGKLFSSGLNSTELSYLKNNSLLTKKGLSIIGGDLTVVNKTFLQKRPTLGNKVYQVNFKSITANGGVDSYKAGEVLASFTNKTNFPTKLVLPKGFSYDLKTDDLDGDFVKTNALKDKIKTLTDIGTIEISEPELRILPDRIQYVKKTKLSFTTEAELNNIKTNLSEEFNLSEKSVNDIKTKLNGVTLQNQNVSAVNPQLVGTKQLSIYKGKNNIKEAFEVKNVSLQNVNDGLNSDLFAKYKNKNANTLKSDAFNSISNFTNDEITQKVQTECLEDYSETQCNEFIDDTMVKELETEEVINIGLIPASNKDGQLLIELDPSSLVISSDDILSRFEVLEAIEKTKTGDDYDNIDDLTGDEQTPVFNDPEKYCDEMKPKASDDELKACVEAVDKMKEVTPNKYSKDFLNGFTIGENKAYTFGTTLRVSLVFTTIKVFQIKITFSYGYAFGVRIPMRVKSVISDTHLQDYYNTGSKTEESSYTTVLNIDTLDGDDDFYKNVLDDENDYHSYGGKEFVFEFTANINVYIRIVGMGSGNGISVDIPLVSTLIVALSVAAEVGGGGIADVANTFGLGEANILNVYVSYMTDFLLNDTAELLDIDRSTLNTGLTITNGILTGLSKGTDFTFGSEYETAWGKVYDYVSNHDNLLYGEDILEWGQNQRDWYNEYKDALKTVSDNWAKVVSQAGDYEIAGASARILQSAMITEFVINNKIDLGFNFKPPYGDEEMPLYTLESPEIPFYNDGLFKLVSKIGVDSSLGGRITANCDEVNSDGACPNIFYEQTSNENTYDFGIDLSFDIDGVKSFIAFKKNVDKWISNVLNDHTDNSSSYIIGTDESRLHFDKNNGIYVGNGVAKDGEGFSTDALGRYSNYGIRLNDFRYHPTLIFTLFAKAGAGLKIPYIGRYTYWTPKIDLYTFEFSSDSIYLSQHEGTDGELDMTVHTASGGIIEPNKVYTTTAPNLNHIDEIIFTDISKRRKTVMSGGEEVEIQSWDRSTNMMIYSEGLEGGYYSDRVFSDDINNTLGNHIYYNYTSSYGNADVPDPEDPACDVEGTTKMYENYETLIWPNFKTDFHNQINVRVRARVCNNLFGITSPIFDYHSEREDGTILGPVSFKNEYQQPFIRESNKTQGNVASDLTFNIDAEDEGYYLRINKTNGLEGYSTLEHSGFNLFKKEYIKYLITDNPDDVLTCNNGNYYNDEKFVQQNPGNKEIGVFSDDVTLGVNKFGLGDSKTNIKIVKCARRDDGSVFQSYVKNYGVYTKSSKAASDWKSDHTVVDVVLVGDVVLKPEIFDGFGKVGGGFDPTGEFMNKLNGLLVGGKISLETISTMNTMMVGGDMGGPGLGSLGGMKNVSTLQREALIKVIKTGKQISTGGLLSMNSVIKSKKASLNGFIELAALYNEYGVLYNGNVKQQQVEQKQLMQQFEQKLPKQPIQKEQQIQQLEQKQQEQPIQEEQQMQQLKIMTQLLEIGDMQLAQIMEQMQQLTKEEQMELMQLLQQMQKVSQVEQIKSMQQILETLGVLQLRKDELAGLIRIKDLEKIKQSSDDEYVNTKLKEINNCFNDTYVSHLENIEKTIKTLESNRDKAKDEKTKEKYQKAINKLSDIKELFIKRYENILNYDEKDSLKESPGVSSEKQSNLVQNEIPLEDKGVGDSILKSMEKLKATREEKEKAINEILSKKGDEPMSVQDAMRLQLELHQLNLQTEMTTKAADKSSQGVQSLFKNQ